MVGPTLSEDEAPDASWHESKAPDNDRPLEKPGKAQLVGMAQGGAR
jgi:phosphohistidine phosphatase SixA